MGRILSPKTASTSPPSSQWRALRQRSRRAFVTAFRRTPIQCCERSWSKDLMSISRRKMLQTAAAGGGFVLAPQVAAGQAPAQVKNTQTGRTFKAFLRFGTGTITEELTLLPIQDREVVIRSEAAAVCYTIVGGVLRTTNSARPSIPNHSGMGVVEAIGSNVKRVQVGDRCIIPGTPQCGVCYMCL